ncbi:MAG: hypothetical protein RL299_1274 [Pseudomonadota bacterium]
MYRPILASLAAALVLAGPVEARPPIAAKWPLLAFDRQGSCELTINSNGKFMWIAVSGLIPGTRASFALSNGRMTPIAWNVLADSSGSWSTPYVPMPWGQDGSAAGSAANQGAVEVQIEAAGCELAASAPWSREVRVIP